MAQPTRLQRKLSAKTITGNDREANRDIAASDKGKFFPQYSIIGTARGFKTGTSNFGDWIAVTGEFEATNLGTGEVFNGGTYFPPPYVADLLTPAMTAGGSNAAIEFALVVGITYADNAFGFEYVSESYMDPADSDTIKRLRAIMPAPQEILKLASPTKSGAASKPAEENKS